MLLLLLPMLLLLLLLLLLCSLPCWQGAYTRSYTSCLQAVRCWLHLCWRAADSQAHLHCMPSQQDNTWGQQDPVW
jgi:hypothetical protein